MSSIHDKIRNLLEMAEGKANDNESEQALKMAHTLMMKHGIEQSELHQGQAEPTIGEGNVVMDKIIRFHEYCGHAVNKLYGTRYVRTGKTNLRFCGRSDNVVAAELTFIYIVTQINEKYKAALPKGMSKRERAHYRADFKDAAAYEVYQRCVELTNQPSLTGGTALVVHQEQLSREIDDYFEAQNIKSSRKSRGVTRSRNSAAFGAGIMAGQQVDIHKEVK